MKGTEKAVADYLASVGIEYAARYCGEQTREQNWKCDAWAAEFRETADRERRVEFDYYTGTGLRQPAKNAPRMPTFSDGRIDRWLVKNEWEQRWLKPVPPPAAGVLQAVIMDADACRVSFAEWCSEYGFDEDSRKALATYDACQRNGDKARRFFGAAVLDRLAELLQDY